MRFFMLIVKNIRRSPVRSSLTALGTIMLVLVVTLIWSVLFFLERATTEKAANLKVVVTERWSIPSRMPFSYERTLSLGAARSGSDDLRPMDSMSWQFYGGTLDGAKMTRESVFFAIAMQPRCVVDMLDELDELPEKEKEKLRPALQRMDEKPNGIVVGRERLAQLNKGVGDRFKVTSFNYKGIDLEFEVMGILPEGRYNNSAFFNREYLLNAMDRYAVENKGKKHPMAEKTLNLVWLRVADRQQFERIASQILNSPDYSTPAVKCETASSGIATFLDSYRDLLWAAKWLLVPAIVATLALIIAIAISISVRERRTEMAVLKVLGFRPRQILVLILGEALLLGALSGLLSATGTYYVINNLMGGIKFPIAFFGAFFIPWQAMIWGLCLGSMTAFLGSAVPAYSACSVKVSEVFSKIT